MTVTAVVWLYCHCKYKAGDRVFSDSFMLKALPCDTHTHPKQNKHKTNNLVPALRRLVKSGKQTTRHFNTMQWVRWEQEYRHTLFRLASLYCSLQKLCFQTEGLWQPCVEQASLSAPFFRQHLLTSCLCHILAILPIFQTFSLLLYLLCWSVIRDLWRYYCKKIMTCWRLR